MVKIMNKLQNELAFYNELAEEIKPHGFKCFLYNEGTSAWLYIITPSDSWLYLDNADFYGYDLSYEYTPSRDCGSGCRYNENSLTEVTIETLLKAEQYGKSFRCKNGRKWAYPKHYASGIEAMRKSWCADKLIEL